MLDAFAFRELALLAYPATISLSTSTLTYLTRALQAHRVVIRSPWRRLSARDQALLVLAHLRTYVRLAAGFGVGLATVYRYLREAVDLLAAQAPSLPAALWALAATFNTFALLDGRSCASTGWVGRTTGATTRARTAITASTCKG